ncbi:MAG: amphi-Trp domain-containing protein [Anaerolineae bacterium]
MAQKNVLFTAEEWKSRESTAAFLRELADNVEAGEVTLRRGEEQVSFALPETVELEIKVTEKVKNQGTERQLEIEIEWTEGQAQGPVTVG